jgi:hypothetical protein
LQKSRGRIQNKFHRFLMSLQWILAVSVVVVGTHARHNVTPAACPGGGVCTEQFGVPQIGEEVAGGKTLLQLMLIVKNEATSIEVSTLWRHGLIVSVRMINVAQRLRAPTRFVFDIGRCETGTITAGASFACAGFAYRFSTGLSPGRCVLLTLPLHPA